MNINYNKNYYTVLSVSKDASKNEIEKMYKKLVSIYHPDNFESFDEETKKINMDKMLEINEAYEILSNNDNRKE